MPTVDFAEPIDVVILSNGPGEVATWVKPVVREISHKTADTAPNVRISVILSPCPHASGQESYILEGYPEVARTQSAEDRKSTRLNSSHVRTSRMPSSA